MPQHPARELRRLFPIGDGRQAIDVQPLHAGGELVRLVVRRRVAKRLRVEHDYVGEIPGL